MKTIKSKDIIDQISDNTQWSYQKSKVFYNEFIKIFRYSLKTDKKLCLTNFGSFFVKSKNKRIARNPKTGEHAIVVARNVAKFKVSIRLKKKIENNNYGEDCDGE